MKSLCTKGILYFSLALLVVAAVACTQSKPAAPTPTLVPLANETIVIPSGNESPVAPAGNQTPVDSATLVPLPADQTPVAPPGDATPVPPPLETPGANVTPIIVEPTLLPTPTTVGDSGQPSVQPTPGVPGGDTGAQPTGACSNPYVVQPGEWFYAIARKCGVTPQALLAANPGMNPNLLRPGQQLNMPGGTSGGGAPPPAQPTDTTGGTQPPSGSCSNPYVVQRGDTLYSIAQKCGTTVAALQQANGIPAPEYIFPGQQLRIP
ncbi:MAG: LysM peptidoglycan-binding domain-containing protein [Chloroflexi bacterium]|nr:LysM peptidoglycan-binding domain-containing protein [Chloroflexota bacterium]